MKKLMVLTVAAMGGALFAAEAAKDAKGSKAAQDPEQVEARARRMIKNAVSLFDQA